MDEEETTTTRDKVMKMATINFSITKCPQKVYEEFVMFCQSETNDNYSMGLKMLIELYKTNAKENHIFNKLEELESEIEQLKKQPNNPTETQTQPDEKTKKTFGIK